MKKWPLLEKIRDDLAAKKISDTEALRMLINAVECYSKSNSSIEYKVFMNELSKLKRLTERINSIIEENKRLESYNNILLHYALMSDEELEKNRQYILKLF
ncbi:MAG: hypothetical protein AAF934_12760 [Bacteroidota bacterium]